MDHISRSQHSLYGVCLIAAQALLVAATLCWHDLRIGAVGGVLTFYALALWIGGIAALGARLRPRMPRSALIVTSMGTLGSVAGATFGAAAVIEAQIGPETYALAQESGEAAWAFIATFLAPGILFPLAVLLFGVLLIRARAIPAWCGVLLCLGGVLFPLRFPKVQWMGLVADFSLLLPALWLGVQHLRESRREAAVDSVDTTAVA